jgi:hypothetical protein
MAYHPEIIICPAFTPKNKTGTKLLKLFAPGLKFMIFGI